MPAAEKSHTRDYIILVDVQGRTADAAATYEYVTTVNAGSPEQAIRRANEGTDLGSTRQLVAIPTRNWTAQDAATETPPPVTRYTPAALPGATPHVAPPAADDEPAS